MFTATHQKESHKDRVKSAVNHAEEGGRRIKKDLRDTAEDVQGDLSSMAHNLGSQVREAMDSAGEGLSYAKESIMDASDMVAKEIKRRPLPAGAMLLAAGILVGAFLRRR